METPKFFLNCLLRQLRNQFWNYFSWKRLVLLLSSVFLFIYFQDIVDHFIKNFLSTKADVFKNIPSGFLIAISAGFVARFIFIFFNRKYKVSFFQLWVSLGTIACYYYFWANPESRSWDYIILSDNYNVLYIHLLIIPLEIFVFSSILVYFWSAVLACQLKKTSNILYEDNPILNSGKDLFEYQVYAKKIAEIILNQNSKKSFTIGIVGPWGNGKSSLVQLLEQEIKETKDKSITSLYFYPYLNHKEEEIISEFFTLLSNSIKKYNGSLSNQLLAYSDKLIQLYQNHNLKDFFDNRLNQHSDSSASELYAKINHSLESINRKHIIYVDDLDRLNEKEILQVLKLIRNTANFFNFHFVVALDKEYVLASLKNKESILNTKFIDKFFQLEMYLPELDKVELKNIFINHIEDSKLGSKSQFVEELRNTLNTSNNLFDDYINNVRDIKRVANQLIFDYEFTNGGIDLNDFLNFTYLKLKFPKVLKLLNDQRDKYLHVMHNQYRLISLDENAEGDEIQALQIAHEFNKNYRETELFNSLTGREECSELTTSLDCEDLELVVKTLYHLFGGENLVNNHRSIKFIGNFRKLMRLRYEKDDLTNEEFINLLNVTDFKSVSKEISDLSTKKIQNALANFEYFKASTLSDLKSSILFLTYLLEKRSQYQVNETIILKNMAEILISFAGIKEQLDSSDSEISRWLKNELFEQPNFSAEIKLKLLGHLWNTIDSTFLWGYDGDYFENKTVSLFKEYINGFKIKLWPVNDFSFFGVYHSIKKIGEIQQTLNKIICDFWTGNNVELLCVQSTEFHSFSLSAFMISDGVKEIYGSKEDFHKFIQKHQDHHKPEIQEFLSLYNLMAITNYQIPIVYTFKKSSLMSDKKELTKNIPGRSSYDEYDKHIQVFYETTEKILIDQIMDLIINRVNPPKLSDMGIEGIELLQFSALEHDDKYYLLIGYDKKHRLEPAIQIMKIFEKIAAKELHTNKQIFAPFRIKVSHNLRIILEKDKYIQVISRQP